MNFILKSVFNAIRQLKNILKDPLYFTIKKPPGIHDLVRLSKACSEIDNDFSDIIDDCAKITDYYVLLRYPVVLPLRTKNDAELAVNIASKIEELISQKVK